MTEVDALRHRFLDWLYDQRPDQPGALADVRGFVGPAGADHEAWRGMLRQLESEGLILFSEGLGGLDSYRARLTGPGRGHVRSERAAGTVGRAAGPVPTAGPEPTELVTLLRAIIEVVPALGLSDRDAIGLREAATQAAAEVASAEPDPSWVESTLHRTVAILGRAHDSTAAAALSAYLRVLTRRG